MGNPKNQGLVPTLPHPDELGTLFSNIRQNFFKEEKMDTPYTILVAEDNDFVRMQLVRFLEEAGYNVVEAKDGETAFALLKVTPAHVLVLDVRMEPMDGFELIKALETQNIIIPTILVTGDNNPDMLSEASRWHVTSVLMKPVQKDRLLQMVSRALTYKIPPS
jgi:two-component system, response regulator PdtaR